MLDMFRNVPSELMLVFRNLNTIRSITRYSKFDVEINSKKKRKVLVTAM